MRTEHSGIGHFWWRWISGCLIGWFLGFLIGFVVAGSFGGVVTHGPVPSTIAYLGLGIAVGTGVGLMQWRLLRSRFSGGVSWVVTNGLGMGLAGGVGYGAAVLIFGYSEGLEDPLNAPAILGWTLVAACGGLIAGLLQRRILIRQVPAQKADHWVLASTLGWGLSFTAFGTIGAVGFRVIVPVMPGAGALIFFAALIAGGLTLGLVTASTAGELLGSRWARSVDGPAHA